MVVIGAKGHALEILDVLISNAEANGIVFFDNVSKVFDANITEGYRVLTDDAQLATHFKNEKSFVLGLGQSSKRKLLAELCIELGGELRSVIAGSAIISGINVSLGPGINIMHRVIINPDVTIGYGSLINAGAIIHHQSRIGEFCEICPGAIITGNVTIDDFTMVGAGAVILPHIKIGSNVKIGAGSVVTRDVEDNVVVAGNPARVLNKKTN